MRTAKIFKNGGSQAIRLPKTFRFEGSQVFIKKEGKGVLILPYQEPWEVLFESLEQFSDDFMSQREQPETQEREETFE
ncbi:MAG: Antitoxin VapB2 [Chloroflexi bacterium]|nr:Antitoxin VapB2 [Chloroflexota bacterium]